MDFGVWHILNFHCLGNILGMKSEGGSRTGKDKVRRKAPIKVSLFL